jgi:hypothetical protein
MRVNPEVEIPKIPHRQEKVKLISLDVAATKYTSTFNRNMLVELGTGTPGILSISQQF